MTSWAAGLGRLTVNSPLGQPLNAEIEIVSLQPGEEEGLVARLPSNEAFRQAGIELNPSLLDLRFAIEQRGGRPVVRLTTHQPVNEPFLDLLVELQWNTGRLVREYTFLLDPPEYRGTTAIAGTPAATEKPAPLAQVPLKPEAPAKPEATAKPQDPQPAASAQAQTQTQTYEVQKGDTLFGIARQHLPAGVSLEQMLAAIYNANRQAFIAENINLMRSGQILNIPAGDAAGGLGSDEARRMVQSHAASFSEYRKRLAAAPTPAEAAPGQRETAGRIEPRQEAEPAPAAPQDQVRLAKAEPGKPAAAGARAAREDDLVARERALQESQSRVAELEKNVADLQKLLQLRNQQLAELEKRAKEASSAPAAVAPAGPPATAIAPEKPAASPAVPQKPLAEAPKPAAEAPPPVEAPSEAPKPAAEAQPEAPKPVAEAPKPSPRPTPEFKSTKPRAKAQSIQEPSLLDELLENPLALGGLLLVLLLLIGYGGWVWRRKKAGQARFQDSVLGAASAPAAAPAVAGPVSSQVPSESPVGGMEPEEVDPIAEADVYMAYGRDAQAEEILKEALQKDPNRAAIHAKLLEIYANRRDKPAFEQSALKLKGLTQGAGPEWEKAAALGRSLDPQSGLYGAGGTSVPSGRAAAAAAPASKTGPTAPSLDFDLGGTTQEATLPDIPLEAPSPRTGPAVDFDLGAATAETKHEKPDFTPEGTLIMGGESAPESPLTGLDFDLDLSTPEEKKAQASSRPASTPAGGDPTLDFDLNLDLGATDEHKPAEAGHGHGAPLDLSSIDLDLSEPPGAPGSGDPKWQEVATKLDLAKAYEEMGDKDGARELLAEVVREGDSVQKGEAEQMLAKLG